MVILTGDNETALSHSLYFDRRECSRVLLWMEELSCVALSKMCKLASSSMGTRLLHLRESGRDQHRLRYFGTLARSICMAENLCTTGMIFCVSALEVGIPGQDRLTPADKR